MKNYNKPVLNIEKFELNNSIAALSTNGSNTLHETVDVYEWGSLFGNDGE